MSAMVKIWDPLVRVFHWSLVASFAAAWLTADESKALHLWAGYGAAGLIAFRILWGLAGTHYARFGQFIKSPFAVVGYLADVISGNENRYLGHNPAGGAMILLLILALVGISVTGWMYTTDAFWGSAWVEGVHSALANILLVLVALHLAGVVLASLRHNENLVRAMVTGRKRTPAAGDVS